MQKMGFDAAWIKLMMGCISKATYSILINGEPHGNITPTRGLCQDDPLFPYSFPMHRGFSWLVEKDRNYGRYKRSLYLS